MADVGTGTTIAFATSTFTAEVMNINGSDISREDIETSHMGTTGYKTYIPSKLVDGGTVDLEIAFDPDDQPPVSGASEVITVTFPTPSGGSSGAKVVFTGYVNTWTWTDPLEEKMTASLTVKVDGQTAPAWTAST
ncbi:MAG: hypothetical protein GY938_17835 [Ketobacter sp.]|nr:hypothetical protein [Ketobacter sp.]